MTDKRLLDVAETARAEYLADWECACARCASHRRWVEGSPLLELIEECDPVAGAVRAWLQVNPPG